MTGYEYLVNINLKAADDCGLPPSIDLIDLAILYALAQYSTLDACKIRMVKGKRYYWFNWELVPQRLPRIKSKGRSAVKHRIKKLTDNYLLIAHPDNRLHKKCWFAFGPKYNEYKNAQQFKKQKDVRQTGHDATNTSGNPDITCPANRTSNVRQTGRNMSGLPDELELKDKTDKTDFLRNQILEIYRKTPLEELSEDWREDFLAHLLEINFIYRHANGLRKYLSGWLRIREENKAFDPGLEGELKDIFENCEGYAAHKLQRSLEFKEKLKLAAKVKTGLTGIQLYHLFLPTEIGKIKRSQMNLNFLLTSEYFDKKRFPKTTKSGSKFVKWNQSPAHASS